MKHVCNNAPPAHAREREAESLDLRPWHGLLPHMCISRPLAPSRTWSRSSAAARSSGEHEAAQFASLRHEHARGLSGTVLGAGGRPLAVYSQHRVNHARLAMRVLSTCRYTRVRAPHLVASMNGLLFSHSPEVAHARQSEGVFQVSTCGKAPRSFAEGSPARRRRLYAAPCGPWRSPGQGGAPGCGVV